jgi:uncharacterized protein
MEESHYFLESNTIKKLSPLREITRISGIAITNKLQTNGTLINTKWVNFFKLHDFRVGVSIDGPRSINDDNRVFANGDSAYNDTLRGLSLLAAGGLSKSILSVLTGGNCGSVHEY